MTNTKINQAVMNIQAEMPRFDKDTKNDFFKSKYATLQGILTVALPVIRKHGVLFSCHQINKEGFEYLRAELIHVESGELRASEMKLLKHDDMQKLGAATTYATRYSILSLLGLAPEVDSDGNEVGEEGTQKTKSAEKKATEAKPKEPSKPNPKAEAIAVIKNLLPTLWDKVAEDKIKWLTDVSEGKVDPSESGAVGGAKYLQSLVA